MHHEKRNRSIAKAITYRIISIFMDSIIAFYITHSASKTMAFVLISNSLSIVIYLEPCSLGKAHHNYRRINARNCFRYNTYRKCS